MRYSRTHVDHRNPDHHEAIHPTRNIGNAHVVGGEFLTSRYHEALQTVLHPLGEFLDTHDQHALNDLGIVYGDGSLNDLSLIAQTHVRLNDYWTRTRRTALNELFAERRAHVIGCCTRSFLSEFSRRTLEVESGRTDAALDATLSLLLDNEFLPDRRRKRKNTSLMSTTDFIGQLNSSLTRSLPKLLSSAISSRRPISKQWKNSRIWLSREHLLRSCFTLLLTMRISRDFPSNQYPSEEAVEDENPSFRIETTLKLDSDKKVFDISTHENHPRDGTPTQSFGGTFVFSDWSDLQDVADLLKRYIREQDDQTRSITVPLDSGTGFNSRLGIYIEDIKQARFTVDDYRLEVDAKGHRGEIRYYSKSVDRTQQDRRNAMAFLDMVDELFQDMDEEPILHLEHPDLRSDAVPEYIDGHYQSSVRTAFRVLEEKIREEGGFSQDDTGVSLAQDAFNVDDGPLTFADVGAEKLSWMYLYAGGFGALRNPPSHRNEESINQQRAMQILHYVDLLLDVLEEEATED